MGIRIILKNETAIEVSDLDFSAVKTMAEGTDLGKTTTMTFTDKVIIFTSEISHILNIGGKNAETPNKERCFGYYCNKRSVQYEKSTTIVSLVFCNHKDNPDPCEGNCRKEICPIVKAIKDI